MGKIKKFMKKMGSSLILVGLGMAAVGLAGRVASRHAPKAFANMEQVLKNVQTLDSGAWANSKYHKGGFEPKMSKREAALILGVSPTATKKTNQGKSQKDHATQPSRPGW